MTTAESENETAQNSGTQGSQPSVIRSDATRRREDGPSLTQQVYERIRSDIFTCVLEPGREISEAELAARFEMSKTPVREALAALRAEGFVNTFPRRGYQIAPITFADMQELFDVRTIVEAGAAEMASGRITEEELERLARLADGSSGASDRPGLKRFIQANRDFHGAIAKASHNERLHQLVLRQMDALERFFYLGARLRDVSAETRTDHHQIVDILRTHNPRAAREIIVEHNEVTRRGLFEALSRSLGSSQIRF